MKHCIISDYHFSKKVKNCQMCKKHHYSLIDRKSKEFKIITDNYCNNYIIHSLTLSAAENYSVVEHLARCEK